jgi:2-phospho-L-lactate guanylyltransferase
VTVALIPVKDLALAKARLSPVLDAAGRRALALAMFRDVLEAALGCDAIEGVAVVSRDAEVLDEARAAGAEAMPEPGGLNEALTSAAKKLAKRGVERILVLAADLPTMDASDLETITVLEARVDVALAVVRDGGTGAIWLAPGAIEFAYGAESAERHINAAEREGLSWSEVKVPTLAFDIDTPEDLQDLVFHVEAGRAIGAHTRAALESLGLLSGTRT